MIQLKYNGQLFVQGAYLLILHKNLYRGCSLEINLSRRNSYEHPEHEFVRRIDKNYLVSSNMHLYVFLYNNGQPLPWSNNISTVEINDVF